MSDYDFGRLLVDTLGIQGARLSPCRQKDVIVAAPRDPDVSLDSARARSLGFNPSPLREELKGIAW